MRTCIAFLACTIAALSSAAAQPQAPSSSVTPEQRRLVSDERAAEVKRMIEAARQRQTVLDQQNTDLWTRWIYAVCIGCEEVRTPITQVYTNPLRVLVGIPAAMDDRAMAKRRQPTQASVRLAQDRARETALTHARDAAGADPTAARHIAGRRISDRLPAGGTMA